MPVHTVSSKGWVVIPAKYRKKYSLKPGAEVRIVDYGGVLSIIPVMGDPVDQAAGMIGSGKKLTEVLVEEHRSER